MAVPSLDLRLPNYYFWVFHAIQKVAARKPDQGTEQKKTSPEILLHSKAFPFCPFWLAAMKPISGPE